MENKIKLLESLIKDTSKGLPENIFLFISRITPLVNVDLLIKNEQNHTLVTWRDDDYCTHGWHIPGGVIRYKETFSDRIKAVASTELGSKVKFNKTPLAINEVILPSLKNRAHSVSLLFECSLISPLDKNLIYSGGDPKQGQWAWYDKCPGNIISVHEMYRRFF